MANSYVDDLHVKISEKYKPPIRINMPMSYSQRLTINKQLQDNRATYDFEFEKTTLNKVWELKEARRSLVQDRKDSVERARRIFEERLTKERLEKEKTKEKRNEDISSTTVEDSAVVQTETLSQGYVGHNQPTFRGNSGILTPTPASDAIYANILKPIPLQQTINNPVSQKTTKPFNLSDFESDTSSPFDNMELKSINDLEELAQVLQREQKNFQPHIYPQHTSTAGSMNVNSSTKSYSVFPESVTSVCGYGQTISNSNAYNVNNCYSQANMYNNYFVPSVGYSVPSTTSMYNNFNGYIYKNPVMECNTQLVDPYKVSKTTCKSVPDLVKSLDGVSINEKPVSESSYRTTDVQLPVRPKSTEAVCSKAKMKDDICDAFEKLTGEQKELCQGVSLMGFPLDRVARVCLIIGNDQKKLVDHLLALSDLLDLGFSENTASEALIKNDNDRDKALDLLIS